MKRKLLSAVLALAVILTYAVPACAFDNKGEISVNANVENQVLKVDVSATGSTVTAEDKVSTPCDIVMVLDQSGSMSEKYDLTNTKQKALKKAAGEFLDEIGVSNNRVAVVSFANDAKVISGWTDMNASGISSLKTSLNALPDKPKGATYMDKGLSKAGSLISSRTEKDRKVIVIMFTDGYPGETSADGDYFSNFYDTPDEADDAVSEASKLKKMGATIFTVGAFDGAKPYSEYKTTKKKIIWTVWRSAAKSVNGLMHFISSDYDSGCTSWKKNTTSNDGRNNGFYLSADNTKQLSQSFTEIASEYIKDDKEITLGKTAAVRLALSEDFKVAGEVTATGNAKVRVDGREIYVTGYDYTANPGSKVTVSIPFKENTSKYGNLYLLESCSGVYDAEGNILKYAPSVKANVIDTFDIDDNIDNSSALQKYFNSVFESNDFYNNQWQTMKTVEQLEDNVYLMDYKYDYDIHDLMDKGVSSMTELLEYCSGHLLNGMVEFNYGNEPLGCTTLSAFNEEGDSIMGRNFDFKPAPSFVVWTHPDDAYASIAMADANFMLYGDNNTPTSTMNRFQTLLAPYCCVDGLNEKGLCIGVLELDVESTNQDTGKTDMITTAMIRAALDTCADVDETIKLFASYDMHDSLFACYHYQVTDASGKSAIIEYVNNEMRVIYPGDKEYDEYMEGYEGKDVSFAANFFLSKDADHSADMGNKDTDDGGNRAKTVTDALKATGGVMSEDEMMGVLKGVSMSYEQKILPWPVKTLWSNVYNCNDKTLLMSPAMKYDTRYRFEVDSPKKVIK